MFNIFNFINSRKSGTDDTFPRASTGDVAEIGPFRRKAIEAIAKAKPELAKKIVDSMDINTERATTFWHDNVESSGVDKETIKKAYDAWRGKGVISSKIPKKKYTEDVKNTGKAILDNDKK